MKKMMTYSEANSVLGSSLSPKNRCLSKSVAIANDANPDLLTNFEKNRLVPASVIEPNTSWIDEHTIEHYFVDENGNNLGTSLNIVTPKNAAYYIVRTKALLDGQPFPEDMMGGAAYADDEHPLDFTWVHNEGNISYSTHNRYSDLSTGSVNYTKNVRTIGSSTTSHWPKTRNDGITDLLIYFRDTVEGDYSWGSKGKLGLTININTDTAKLIKMDYVGSFDPWLIVADFSKNNSDDCSLSNYNVYFSNSTPIEECIDTVTVTGFEEGFSVKYIGWHRESDTLNRNSDNKFSNVSIPTETGNNTIKITCFREPVESDRWTYYNVYKLTSATNPNKFLYFQVSRQT